MPLDPAIYSAFAPKQTSALDTLAALGQVDAQRGTNALQQLQIAAGQGQLQDAQQARTDRNALYQLLASPTFNRAAPDAQAQLYRVAPSQAAATIKTWQDQDQATAKLAETKAATGKDQAQASHFNAQTQGLTLDQQIKRRQDHVAQLAGVSDVPSAVQWINDAVRSSELPMDRAAQVIQGLQSGQMPVRQWVQQAMMGGLSLLDQIREQRERDKLGRTDDTAEFEYALGRGEVPAGTSFTDWLRNNKRAGASNVTVNAEKPLVNEIGTGLGKQLDASLASAMAAQKTIGTAQRIRQLAGSSVTGPGADWRTTGLRLGTSLNVPGINDPERLANTSELIRNLAQGELDAAGQMKGQGQITEAERALLQRAASGNVNMTAPELVRLSQTMEKTARARIVQHQELTKKLGGINGATPLMPFYEVQAPAETPSAGGGSDIDALVNKYRSAR